MEHTSTQLKELLVPVDGTQASLDAVALACALARRNKGKVYVVYVIEVARTLPLDADLVPESNKGEDILSRAEQVADSLDFEVEGELLQAREAGHAVVDEAIERGVDGIVLGVEYMKAGGAEAAFTWERGEKPRPLRGDLKLGPVAQHVLLHSPCEVLLIRKGVRQEK
ncbi:MAG: universal stress protein [Dehalococcoidia bacterium]